MKIEPFKVNVFDTEEVDTLEVTIASDNLKNKCILTCTLYKESELTNIPSRLNKNTYSQNLNVEGEDYDEWDGNNNFPYQYVIAKLGLIPIKEKVKIIEEEAKAETK